jgi:putative peptidoglycan lipid II flippase
MASEGKITEFRNTISSSLNLVFLMTLPSAFGLVVLSEPIIRLIYERGKFDSADTTMTAWALMGYSIGLTGYAAIKVLSPAFYALDDAKTPMLIALFSIIVNAIASFAFRDWFSGVGVSGDAPSGLGHVGVALATSSVALVNFLALVFFMRRRISRINGREILSSFARILVASVLMSLAAYGVYFWISSRIGIAGFVPKLIDALLPIAVGGAVFFITAKLLGIRELEQVYNSFARRFRSN